MSEAIFNLSAFKLIESIGAATFVIDKNNTVIYWNEACETLTGVDSDEVINTQDHWKGFYSYKRPCLADLALKTDRKNDTQHYPHIQKMVGPQRALVAYNWCDTPSGLKYLAFEASALFDDSGHVIGAIETLRDISEVKKSEISKGRLALKHKKLFELTKIDFANADETFKAYLKESVKQLGVDRASIWKYNQNRTQIVSLYSLHHDTFDTLPITIDIKAGTRYIKFIESLSFLSINDVRKDHAVEGIRDYIEANDIFSLLDVPIVINGEVQYILCHENSGAVKEWSSEDKDFVRSVGDIIGNKLISIINKENEDKLKYYASHDALTGLLNRYSFEKEIKSLFNTNEKEFSHVIFFMDLDQFKVINDTSGHKAGDELITHISQILNKATRNNDILARLGGDEFGILLKTCPLDNALTVADKIIQNVSKFRFHWNNKQFRVGISIGITHFSNNDDSFEDILSRADTACYVAKDKGRNRYHLFESTDKEARKKRNEMRLSSSIQKAIDENKFDLYLQGISSLQTDEISYYEVLTRMRDENDVIIMPGKFIPSAERYNLMCKIDTLIVKKSFEFLDKLFLANSSNNIAISINISGQSITEESFLIFLVDIINRYKHLAERVSFELTETAAVSNTLIARHFIKSISNLGCKFALDDFGSGVSSFAYLKHLPFNILKIDGIFVRDMNEDPINQAVIRSINEVSHILGMTTVAEYVENDETITKLKEIGVDYAQGYGISKPFPASELLVTMAPPYKVSNR